MFHRIAYKPEVGKYGEDVDRYLECIFDLG
jgi:hypothetical protein